MYTIFITTIFISLIYIRSLKNGLQLISNVRWLKNSKIVTAKPESPFKTEFIICIPMLREQRIIEETLNYFSKLKYPKTQFSVVIVTTEKEAFQKEQRKKLLKPLSLDLSASKSFQQIKENYLSLFNSEKLSEIYTANKGKDSETISQNISNEYEEYPSTFDMASEIATRINRRLHREFIKVIHYPKIEGVMSHQINYAVETIYKDITNRNTYFVVYNADSRPNKYTLSVVAQEVEKYESNYHKIPNIIQQSSLFTLNYNSLPHSISGYILRAASLFQTKWTLVHELHRLRTQSKNVLLPHKNIIDVLFRTKLAHCVGHGLFVTIDLLSRNPLPTETVNEDLPFGYYQCCKGEPILPVPILENSESPETIKSLLNQKKVWFWPYLEYLKCRRLVFKRGDYRSKLEVNLLTYQAILTGLIWLLQSFVFMTPLLLVLLIGNIYLLIFYVLGLVLYWFLPISYIYRNLSFLESLSASYRTERSARDLIFSSVGGIFVISTHSIGPINCILDFIRIKFSKKALSKEKTER